SLEFPDPQLKAGCLSIRHQEIQAAAIERKLRADSISFGRDLMVAIFVVQPYGAVLRADGCNQRLTISGHRNALLRGRAESKLFGFSVRKTLTPDVKFAGLNIQVHPLTIERPCAGNTPLTR